MQLTELLDRYQVPYRRPGENRHVTEGWVGTDCIYCSPGSSKFKLGFHLATNATTCWTCGRHSFTGTLAQITRLSEEQVRSVLDRAANQTIVQVSRPRHPVLPSGLGPLQSIHKDYLRYRDFDPDELEQLWNLQGIGLTTNLSWRVFIPIHHRNQIVSWTTRAISEQVQPRYISAPADQEAIPAKELLYGSDLAGHAVVICEGPVDVWRIGPGAVATLGVSYSRAQLSKLTRYPVRAVCFDSEPAAQIRAAQLCEALEAFPGSTYLVQLNAKDPGSANQREIDQLRRTFL